MSAQSIGLLAACCRLLHSESSFHRIQSPCLPLVNRAFVEKNLNEQYTARQDENKLYFRIKNYIKYNASDMVERTCALVTFNAE